MAATYDFTPVNGGDNAVGTLETTAQINGFLIVIKNGSGAAVDLRAVDGSYGSVYDMILREINPMMAHALNDNSGTMSVIMDAAHTDATSLQRRLANIDGVGSDSTVTAASSFAVA